MKLTFLLLHLTLLLFAGGTSIAQKQVKTKATYYLSPHDLRTGQEGTLYHTEHFDREGNLILKDLSPNYSIYKKEVFEYDKAGRETLKYSIDSTGNQIHVHRYTYNEAGDVSGFFYERIPGDTDQVFIYEYENEKLIRKTEDFGRGPSISDYVYNSKGDLIAINGYNPEEKKSTPKYRFSHDHTRKRYTKATLRPNGKPYNIQIYSDPEHTQLLEGKYWDENEKLIQETKTRYAKGLLVEQTNWDYRNNRHFLFTFSYDQYGNILSKKVTIDQGKERLLSSKYLLNDQGQKLERYYLRNEKWEVVEQYEYDAKGRLTARSVLDSQGKIARRTEKHYDQSGRLSETRTLFPHVELIGLTPGNGQQYIWSLPGNNKTPQQKVEPPPPPPAQKFDTTRITYVYNNQDSIIEEYTSWHPPRYTGNEMPGGKPEIGDPGWINLWPSFYPDTISEGTAHTGDKITVLKYYDTDHSGKNIIIKRRVTHRKGQLWSIEEFGYDGRCYVKWYPKSSKRESRILMMVHKYKKGKRVIKTSYGVAHFSISPTKIAIYEDGLLVEEQNPNDTSRRKYYFYDAQRRLTHFQHKFAGFVTNQYYSYDSKGRLKESIDYDNNGSVMNRILYEIEKAYGQEVLLQYSDRRKPSSEYRYYYTFY